MSVQINGNDRQAGLTLVIGLGNPLMGDDGIGLELLERLRAGWTFPADVVFVDGGTWGMNLLPLIEDAGRILFLDAVNIGQPPGTPVRLLGDRIPRWLGFKLSPHQIDLKEVLALAELRGRLPRDTVVVGVQPALVEMQLGLSPAADEAVDLAVELALATLEGWGHRGRLKAWVVACA